MNPIATSHQNVVMAEQSPLQEKQTLTNELASTPIYYDTQVPVRFDSFATINDNRPSMNTGRLEERHTTVNEYRGSNVETKSNTLAPSKFTNRTSSLRFSGLTGPTGTPILLTSDVSPTSEIYTRGMVNPRTNFDMEMNTTTGFSNTLNKHELDWDAELNIERFGSSPYVAGNGTNEWHVERKDEEHGEEVDREEEWIPPSDEEEEHQPKFVFGFHHG